MGVVDLNPNPTVRLPNNKAVGNLGIRYSGSNVPNILAGTMGMVLG